MARLDHSENLGINVFFPIFNANIKIMTESSIKLLIFHDDFFNSLFSNCQLLNSFQICFVLVLLHTRSFALSISQSAKWVIQNLPFSLIFTIKILEFSVTCIFFQLFHRSSLITPPKGPRYLIAIFQSNLNWSLSRLGLYWLPSPFCTTLLSPFVLSPGFAPSSLTAPQIHF